MSKEFVFSFAKFLFHIILFIPKLLFRILKWILYMFLFIPKTIFELIFSLIKLALIIGIIALSILYWDKIKSIFGYKTPSHEIEESVSPKVEDITPTTPNTGTEDPCKADTTEPNKEDSSAQPNKTDTTTEPGKTDSTTEPSKADPVETNKIDASDSEKIEDLDSHKINNSDAANTYNFCWKINKTIHRPMLSLRQNDKMEDQIY